MKTKIHLFGLLFFNISLIFPQTLDEIIDLQFDAMKQDKFNKVQSLRLDYKIKSGNQEGALILFHKRNNLLRIEKKIADHNTITVINGINVWRFDLNSKKFIDINPFEKDQLIFRADLDGYFFCYKEKKHNLELVGKERLDKKDFFKINCTKPNGDQSNIYIDAKSYLIDHIIQTQLDGEQIFETQTYYSNYKLQDGIPFPNKIKVLTNGQSEELKLSELQLNIDLPDSLFNKDYLLK